MSLSAGKLRHKITIEEPVSSQDENGAITTSYVKFYSCYANIAPLSAREFLNSGATQNKTTTRITIRYNDQVNETMRIVRGDKIYNIEAILPDNDSGIEYLTLTCSDGLVVDGTNQSS